VFASVFICRPSVFRMRPIPIVLPTPIPITRPKPRPKAHPYPPTSGPKTNSYANREEAHLLPLLPFFYSPTNCKWIACIALLLYLSTTRQTKTTHSYWGSQTDSGPADRRTSGQRQILTRFRSELRTDERTNSQQSGPSSTNL